MTNVCLFCNESSSSSCHVWKPRYGSMLSWLRMQRQHEECTCLFNYSWSFSLSQRTPLHLAAMTCSSTIVGDLLEEGARPNMEDKQGVPYNFISPLSILLVFVGISRSSPHSFYPVPRSTQWTPHEFFLYFQVPSSLRRYWRQSDCVRFSHSQ